MITALWFIVLGVITVLLIGPVRQPKIAGGLLIVIGVYSGAFILLAALMAPLLSNGFSGSSEREGISTGLYIGVVAYGLVKGALPIVAGVAVWRQIEWGRYLGLFVVVSHLALLAWSLWQRHQTEYG